MGKVGEARGLLFENTQKKTDDSPDLTLYLVEEKHNGQKKQPGEEDVCF
jgi:hypothetical protein